MVGRKEFAEMFKFLHLFGKSDDGAVTVDWVVMTAMVIGLALAVIMIFHDGPTNVGKGISSRLANNITVVP